MAKSSKQLGQRIRELRKQKGLTQEQLGDYSGVGAKYISQVERTGANVTLSLAESIAGGLGVDLKDLFDFNHNVEDIELRGELISMLESAEGEKLQTLHRVIRAILI
jgi:transcriptional regulator with XRE-family HTH domain